MPQLGHRPGLHGSAVLDDRHRVAEAIDLGHDVAGHEDCAALVGRPAHRFHENLRLQRVQAAGGLVEDEQLAGGGQRGHEHDLLPIPLGVGAHRLGGVEAEGLGQRLLAPSIPRTAQPGQGVQGLGAGQPRPQGHIAGHIGRGAGDRRGVAARIHAQDPDGPGITAVHAQQDADGGGLARSVGAEESVDLSRLDRQVEAVDGPQSSEDLGQAAHLNGGGAVGVRHHEPRLMCDAASHATGPVSTGSRSPSPGPASRSPVSGIQGLSNGTAPVLRQRSIASMKRCSTNGPILA